MKENRKHSRLPIVREAEIVLKNGTKYTGKTKNISFGGLFIELDDNNNIDMFTEYGLVLLLEGSQGRLELKIHSESVHKTDTGIGFKFLRIEIDHYEHLKNLLVHNSSDPGKLLDELEENPGLELD